MYTLLMFVFFIIFTEAITEIVVKSDLFDSLRTYIYIRRQDNSIFNFLYRLTDCGYCFSVWVGWFSAILLSIVGFPTFINRYLDWIILGIVLHRCSNLFHYIMDISRNIKQDKV